MEYTVKWEKMYKLVIISNQKQQVQSFAKYNQDKKLFLKKYLKF